MTSKNASSLQFFAPLFFFLLKGKKYHYYFYYFHLRPRFVLLIFCKVSFFSCGTWVLKRMKCYLFLLMILFWTGHQCFVSRHPLQFGRYSRIYYLPEKCGASVWKPSHFVHHGFRHGGGQSNKSTCGKLIFGYQNYVSQWLCTMLRGAKESWPPIGTIDSNLSLLHSFQSVGEQLTWLSGYRTRLRAWGALDRFSNSFDIFLDPFSMSDSGDGIALIQKRYARGWNKGSMRDKIESVKQHYDRRKALPCQVHLE